MSSELTRRDIAEYAKAGKVGFWKLELRDGTATRLFVDPIMRELMGAPEGFTPEQLRAFFGEHIHPDDRQLAADFHNDAIVDETEVVYRYIHPAFGEMRVRCSGRLMRAEGNLVVIMGHHQALSGVVRLGDDRQEENRLIKLNRSLQSQQVENDDYYRRLLDIASCGVLSYTIPDHRILHMNAEALRIYGMESVEDAQARIGTVLSTVTYSSPHAVERLDALRERDGAVDYEYTIPTPGKPATSIVARTEVFTTPQGGRIAVSTFMDTSENAALKSEKAALQALYDEAKHKNTIIEAISKLYWQVLEINLNTGTYQEVFTNGNFTLDKPHYKGGAQADFNAALSRFVDSASQSGARAFLDLATLPQRLANTESVVAEYQTANGTWAAARFIAQTRDADGVVHSVLFLQQIIDEQKRKELDYQRKLECAIRSAEQANRAKTDFLRRMSHDVRTPVNGIIGMLRIAENNAGNPEKVADCTTKALSAARQLEVLVNDVLDIGKLENNHIEVKNEPFNLYDTLASMVQVVRAYAEQSGVSVIVHTPRGGFKHRQLVGSAQLLNRALMNIATNAVKYNRPGGEVHFNTEELSCEDGVARYRFTCDDTGIGMSEQFQKHAFDPYAREGKASNTSFSGTGLGLAIVKQIVDQLGGEIEMTSVEGEGTHFAITLGFAVDDAGRNAASMAGAVSQLRGKRALFAEDNALNREIAMAMFDELGMSVDAVADGQQAVDAFAASAPSEFDFVLLDIMMPVMDGLSAARAIRKLPRPDATEVPIIAVSANAFQDDVERSLQAGMNAHLTKPLDPKKLRDTLAQVTVGSRGQAL